MLNKFNHSEKIKSTQPLKLSEIQPGMILNFSYKSKNKITDEKPLILILYSNPKTGSLEGLNLNYLNNYQFNKLFFDFKSRNDVTNVFPDPIKKSINKLDEGFTLVTLLNPKKMQSKSVSEQAVEMKRMFDKHIKKSYSKFYRSYKPTGMKSIKSVLLR